MVHQAAARLLQYRERDNPFAAHGFQINPGEKVDELQYRERDKPFAAEEGLPIWLTNFGCCNTAKGTNPLRH